MIMFCVFGIISDFIIYSFFIFKYEYIYFNIAYILNEVFVYCYLGCMMDKLYYHYIEVLLYWGISGLLVKVIIFSSLILYEYTNNIDGYINDIYTYFTETNIAIIIFFQFFYFIIYNGIYYLLTILILYYLRPNHTIITDEIFVYERLIFYQDKPNKYYTLIPFVFQILALLFYFEILEFNFCNLNKNTVKNIEERERKENEKKKSVSTIIELNGQYYLKDDELIDVYENEN